MPLALDILLKIPSVNNLNMRSRLINRFRALAKFKEPYKLTSKSDKKRLEDIFVITKCVEKLFSVSCWLCTLCESKFCFCGQRKMLHLMPSSDTCCTRCFPSSTLWRMKRKSTSIQRLSKLWWILLTPFQVFQMNHLSLSFSSSR